MGKKVEPETSNPPKNSENISEKEKLKNSEGALLSPSLKLQILIGLTCFATVAASYGVQYYRERFVIPPQKEKTFPFSSTTTTNDALRNVAGPDSVLRFINVNTEKPREFKIQVLNDEEQPVSVSSLDFYEYSNSDVYTGGKITFKYANLITAISYIFGDDLSVNVLIECSGRNDPGVTSSNKILISSGKGDPSTVVIQHDTKLYYHISFEKTIIVSDDDATIIEKRLEEMKTAWEQKFETNFQLSNKRMPKPYQDISESALSFAMNSLNVNKTARFSGTYDKNFTNHKPLFYFQSPHFTLKSLDEQVFPLIVTSKINAEDTLQALQSWISTINEHGEMGNQVVDGIIQIEKTQVPMLFQLLKQLLKNHLFEGKLDQYVKNIEEIAENTWKNSISSEGLKEPKWLGHSRGVFQLESATPKGEGSYQLLCLLEDMCKFMQELHKLTGSVNQKWVDREAETESIRISMNGITGLDSHVPLILSLLKPDSDEFTLSLERLQQDPLYGPTGLQSSEENGASIATNFLLLRSLKQYKSLSGPSQEKALQLYSHLKNSLIAAVARSNRPDKSFYGRFDKEMKPLGAKGNLDGTLVLPIMAELQKQN